MLSMFKDKKGFSVLFNKQTDESPNLRSARVGQQRCQRCWKNFAVPSGTLAEDYVCWRCDYPTCRLCREACEGSQPWCCCTCAQSKTLMKLFGKTRYGTDLVVHIMEYCDQRSERILKSFFRAAAMKFAATRMLSNGRPSAHRGSRGSENEGSTGRKSARLSGGGLRVQSPSNINQARSQKISAGHRGGNVAGGRRSGSKGSNKVAKKQQPLSTTLMANSGVVYPDEDDFTTSFGMPTIGTKDQDGVVEYSPSSKPHAQEQHRQQPAPQNRPYFEGASPLAFKDHSDEDEVRPAAFSDHAMETDACLAMPSRPSAFEREEPVTARTAARGAATASLDCNEVSRSTVGARMSRTDAELSSFAGGRENGDDAYQVRLGVSPSPARSASPAPRFPTFAQFLDDQQTLAAQQQLQLQGYGNNRDFTQSRQTISVSPETEEDETSHRGSRSGVTDSRQRKTGVTELGTDRRSGHSRRRTTTGTLQGSLTPRPIGTAARVSGQHSHRSSLELSSAKKMVRHSASGCRTPRGSLHTTGATALSGRRTTRMSGSRRGGSAAGNAHPGVLSTPPLAPLAAVSNMEQLSRTDGSGYDTSPSALSAGMRAGGSAGARTPLNTARSSNYGGSSFMRCATATRLSYGSAQERQGLSTRVGRPLQRRPHSATLTRTGSSNPGLFHRQNSRTAVAAGSGFGRTNSSANHLTRTASSHGYTRQPTTRSRLSGGGNGCHPSPLTRAAFATGNRFGRNASSNGFLSNQHGGATNLRGAPRPAGVHATPLTRTASSGHPLYRQQSFTRTHTATQPFTRTQSANAGLRVGRTATAVPSRLVRTNSANPTFGRSNTSNMFGAGHRSGAGPSRRFGAIGTGTARFGTGGGRDGAGVRTPYGRRPTNTAVATSGTGGTYGRMGGTTSPLLSRGTPYRRGPTTASPVTGASPLRRTNTATGRSNTPAFTISGGATRRLAAVPATASERERLVRTPTQSRFERHPTRARYATPTASTAAAAAAARHAPAGKPTVESAPVLVHMTRRRAGAGAPTTPSAQTTARSTAATTRRLPGGMGGTTHRTGVTGMADGNPGVRSLISSRNATPKSSGRTGRTSIGGADVTSLKSSDSPRPVVAAGLRKATPSGQRHATAGATRSATPTGNVFQRLNTGTRRGPAHPSPRDRPADRSAFNM